MEAPSYFVKVLSAMVKVVRRNEDGTPAQRTVGYHPATGEPLRATDVRRVTLQKGDPLPPDVADGEVERLLALDPPSIGRKAAVSVLSAPSAAGKKSTSKKSSAKKSSAKKTTARRQRTKRATAKTSAAAASAPAADLGDLGSLSDQELVTAISAAGAAALLEAVGSDATLAGRVLAAEMAASSGDPRSELVDGLDKVIQGATSGS